jgi:AraC family carnitine catabolism transcriptional activator
LYRWHVLSADGGAVLASNGMSVNADAALEPLKKGATLMVVAGFEPLEFAHSGPRTLAAPPRP